MAGVSPLSIEDSSWPNGRCFTTQHWGLQWAQCTWW